MRVLFASEVDYRFETYLQRGCLLFAQKLVAKYERLWPVKTVVVRSAPLGTEVI